MKYDEEVMQAYIARIYLEYNLPGDDEMWCDKYKSGIAKTLAYRTFAIRYHIESLIFLPSLEICNFIDNKIFRRNKEH